jgi:DNA-directed RNA polymerase specialized sigma24 family protein
VAEEEAANAELVARLDRIADMMALMVVRGRKQDEQIRLLDALGYAPAQIAAFLAIRRANTVSTALSRARKKTTPRKKVNGRKKASPRNKVAAKRPTRKKPTSR